MICIQIDRFNWKSTCFGQVGLDDNHYGRFGPRHRRHVVDQGRPVPGAGAEGALDNFCDSRVGYGCGPAESARVGFQISQDNTGNREIHYFNDLYSN